MTISKNYGTTVKFISYSHINVVIPLRIRVSNKKAQLIINSKEFEAENEPLAVHFARVTQLCFGVQNYANFYNSRRGHSVLSDWKNSSRGLFRMLQSSIESGIVIQTH